MTEEPEDRHPDDAEAERLLGLLADAMRERAAAKIIPPEGETFNRRRERERRARIARAEIDRVQQVLAALYIDPDAKPITRSPKKPCLPPGPLLPSPPSWRTSLSSYHGAETERAERTKADASIARAIEKALSDLTTNPRAEPPRLTAMQVYDHHVARGERLPDSALGLLARAMRIDPRRIEALEHRAVIARGEAEGRSQKAIAADLGISTRAVRLMRNRPVPDDAALFAAVAEGGNLRALRPAVAEALGLLSEDGRWCPQVVRELTSLPERIEPALIGILADGRFYGPKDDLPDIAADVDFVWQNRTTPSSGGTRKPDLIREAARVEAGRRKTGKEPNNAKLIARATGFDPRWVERWIAWPDWEMAVIVEAVRLRGNAMLRPCKGEVIAYRRGEGLVQMADPRAGKRNPGADRD